MATLVSKPILDQLVVADLREADVMECLVVGRAPEDMVNLCAELSEEFFTTYDKNTPIAVWGYQRKTILGDTAAVWLFSSHAVEGCKKSFAKESRRIVAMLLERFSILEVYVDHRYKRAVNWLSWLGFVPEDSLGPFHIMRCYREVD